MVKGYFFFCDIDNFDRIEETGNHCRIGESPCYNEIPVDAGSIFRQKALTRCK